MLFLLKSTIVPGCKPQFGKIIFTGHSRKMNCFKAQDSHLKSQTSNYFSNPVSTH